MNKKNMPKMNLTLANIYVRNWEKYKKYFSSKALSLAIRKRYQFEFISTEYISISNTYMLDFYTKKRYEQTTEKPVSHQFEEWHGEWMRHVDKLSHAFRVPDRYQLSEEKILQDCLLYDFPYLKNCEINCYRLDDDRDEFYIHYNEATIFCPIKALVEKKPDIIKNRQTTYWKSYYDTPDRKEYLDKQLSVLDSDFFKKLSEDIINN